MIANGGFRNKTIDQVKQEYEENTSDVSAFLIQECIVDTQNPEYSTLATDLYAAYVNFCKGRRALPFEMNIFDRELSKHGIHNARYREHGECERYYDVIEINTQKTRPDYIMI